MQQQFLNDELLVREYINGDESALKILLSRHKPEVFNLIKKRMKNKADDVFQETCIKLVRHLKKGSYKEEEKFLSWMKAIASNTAIEFFRQAKRNEVETMEVSELPKLSEYVELQHLSKNNVEDEVINKDYRRKAIRRLVHRLPVKLKKTILLQHYFAMSFKEISRFSDIKIGTALTRSRNAIIKLREMVNEDGMEL